MDNRSDIIEEKLRRMNPGIKVEASCVEIDGGSVIDMIEGSDIIVDGMDDFPTRYLFIRAEIELNIPLVHGGI